MEEEKLSMTKYMGVLQVEYMQYYWCKMVFDEGYKSKYGKLMKEHEVKIFDISKKLSIKNIFTNKSILKMYTFKLFPEKGAPNFKYRNEKAKNIMHKYNMEYFYSTTNFGYYSSEQKLVCTQLFLDTESVMINDEIIKYKRLYNRVALDLVEMFKYM